MVTGRLDVREVAARLSEKVEASEPLDEVGTETDLQESAADDGDDVPEEAEA